MQLQETKISKKGAARPAEAETSKAAAASREKYCTRQQQSSACTMGHGNPEEAPDHFARPRSNTALKSAQKHQRASLASFARPRPNTALKIAQKFKKATKKTKKQQTAIENE